jgi:hypothetical protein
MDGHRYSAVSEVFIFSPAGAWIQTHRLTRAIEVSFDGDAFTDTVALQIFDPNGNLIVTGCATSVASRLVRGMFGYGRGDSADGRVFEWIFPVGTTYWDQAAAMIAFLGPSLIWTVPVVLLFQMIIALIWMELSSYYPLAGGIYQWARYLGGEMVGFFAGLARHSVGSPPQAAVLVANA